MSPVLRCLHDGAAATCAVVDFRGARRNKDFTHLWSGDLAIRYSLYECVPAGLDGRAVADPPSGEYVDGYVAALRDHDVAAVLGYCQATQLAARLAIALRSAGGEARGLLLFDPVRSDVRSATRDLCVTTGVPFAWGGDSAEDAYRYLVEGYERVTRARLTAMGLVGATVDDQVERLLTRHRSFVAFQLAAAVAPDLDEPPEGLAVRTFLSADVAPEPWMARVGEVTRFPDVGHDDLLGDATVRAAVTAALSAHAG